VSKGVNPIWFPSFWPKPGTGTGVSRFLVLGNQNWNQNPGKIRVPVVPSLVTGFLRKLLFGLILRIGLKISPFFA
jgi:hypothetical protein